MKFFLLKIMPALIFSSLTIPSPAASLGTWDGVSTGIEESVMGIAHGNNTYVAVGTNGYIGNSIDGLNWKKASAGIKRSFNGVTFSGGRFIAVCKAPDEGSGAKIWVSDNGKSWKYRNSDADGDYLTEGLHAVAGDGGGNLVAVGGGWVGRITVSHDNGENWQVKSGASGIGSKLYGVAYGDGVWIAVGTGLPLKSTDGGETWSQISGGPAGRAVTCGGERFVIAGSSAMYWSDDKGTTWKSCVPSKDFESDSFGTGRGVCYANGSFAAVMEKGDIWTSESGIAWRKWEAAGNNPWLYCVTYDGASFVAGGDESLDGAYPGWIVKSPPWFWARTGTPDENPYTVFDFEDSLPAKISLPEYRVNTASLNLILEGSLFYMKTLGAPVNLKLVYCSAPTKDDADTIGLFGKNWRFRYESTVGQFGVEAIVIAPGGRIMTYTTPDGQDLDTATPGSPITLVPPEGVFDKLTFYGPGQYFELDDKDAKLTYRYAVDIDYVWHLSSITDRNGNTVNLTVDGTTGAVDRITDPAGRFVDLEYNSNNLCSTITVPDGRTISFSYDDDKTLTGITDMAGYKGTYEYDELGFILSMNTAGRLNRFTYQERPGYENGGPDGGDDDDKYLASVINYKGKTTSYELLDEDAGVRRTDANGNTMVFKSDDGQTTSVADPLGNIRSLEYGSLKLPTKFTGANGKSMAMEYDDDGNLTSFTDMLGNKTTYTYDDDDNMLSRTDALGNITSFVYDANDRISSATTPLENVTAMTYFANGRMETFTDANGNVTAFTHDGFGNPQTMTGANTGVITFAYDDFGLRCLSITDQRGKIKTMTHDGDDRLLSVTYDSVAGTPAIVNQFDAFGQIKFTNPLENQTIIERNDFGFITAITDPLGFISATEYDPANNAIREVNPLGAVSTQTYDQDNRPLLSTDPLGNEIERSYDDDGNLTTITDKNGNETSFSYDANGALIETVDPLDRKISVTRDKLGRIEITTNARGQKIKKTYDADGREIKKEYDTGGGFTTEAEFSHDSVGNTTLVQDQWGSTTYSYDGMNQVKTIGYPDGTNASFTYDLAGNLQTATHQDGIVASYTYDDYNRQTIPLNFRNAPGTEVYGGPEKPNQPETIAISIDGTSLGTISFEYDATANPTKITLPNGVASSYQYDANQRVTSINHAISETETIVSISYTYDPAGNVIKESLSGDAGISPELPTSTKISYNDAGEIFKNGKAGFSYDADGNLTAIADQGFSASYTPENKPSSITRMVDGASVKTTYTYNGFGLRVKASDGDGTSYYHHSPDGDLLFITNAAGTVTSSRIQANGRLVAIVSSSGGGKILFPHYGANGNILALTDASGAIAAKYAYTPYGKVTKQGSESTPFSFVGAYGVTDEGGGIFLMKNRFYDSSIGRFLQKDPIGYEAGINLYAYANCNPFNQIDPEGLKIGWGKIGTGLVNLFGGAASAFVGGAVVVDPASAPSLPFKIPAAKTMIVFGISRMAGGIKQIIQGLSGQEHESSFDAVADLPPFDPTGGGRKVGNAIGGFFHPKAVKKRRMNALSEDMSKMMDRMNQGDPTAFDQWDAMGDQYMELKNGGEE